jgi:hypothetical protein
VTSQRNAHSFRLHLASERSLSSFSELLRSTVPGTVLGQVYHLSSFPPPDQVLFRRFFCYPSSVNITFSANLSSNSPPRIFINRPCQPEPHIAEADRTSCNKPLTSISNRHNPELEMPVSHRKQTIGTISNRHKFAFCNFPAATPLQACDLPGRRLKLLDFFLTNRKHSTSHFLIDNFRALFPSRVSHAQVTSSATPLPHCSRTSIGA